MSEKVVGRLEMVGVLELADEIEIEIDRARISFAFTKGESWHNELHRLTTTDGRTIEFVVDRKLPYPPDPHGDEEMVLGRVVADYRD